MNTNSKTKNGVIIAGMGGYGCKYFDEAGKIGPAIDDRHISVIQATEDVTISSIEAAWDAPADVAGAVIPAGACMFVKAKSVTVSDGKGFAYYGIGAVG